MLKNKKCLLAVLLLALPTLVTAQCIQQWNGIADQSWNNLTNWTSCIPGSSSITALDSAIFAGVGSGAISLDSPAISPGLNSLLFNNAVSSFAIQSSGSTNLLQFNGPASNLTVLSGSHSLGTSAPNSTQVQLNNTNLAITSSANSSFTVYGNIKEATGSTSAITFSGPGKLFNRPTISNNGIQIRGQFTQKSGNVETINIKNQNTTGTSIPASLFATGSIRINGGTYSSLNTGMISGTSIGSRITNSGDFVIEQALVKFTNNGIVAETGRGAYLSNLGALLLTNGSIQAENNNHINTTLITRGGCISEFSAGATIGDSTINITNNGLIEGGSGCVLNCANTTISDSAISIVNSNTISGDQTARGALLQTTNLQITGGSINIANTALIASTATLGGTASGARIFANGSITLNGGTITLENSGRISAPTSDATGSSLTAANDLIVNSGQIHITANRGSSDFPTNHGNRVQIFGDFQINGGSVINNDTIQTPNLTVQSPGILSGQGYFSSVRNEPTTQITNAGTIKPDVMTIVGGYTQSDTGILSINISNPNTYSKLNLLGSSPGTAQLDGILEITASANASFSAGDTFTIIQTENPLGVSGTFATIIHNTPYLTQNIQYLADRVELSFKPAITEFIGNYTLPILSSINIFNQRIERQMISLRDRFTDKKNPEPIALMAANDELAYSLIKKQKAPIIPAKPQVKGNLYFGPTANVGDVYANENQSSLQYWSAGAQIGYDYAFSALGLGIVLNYNHLHANAKEAGECLSNQLLANLYATYSPSSLPELAINAIFGGGYDWIQIQRPTASNQATGSPNGGELDTLIGVEYTLANSTGFQIVPLASLQYIYLQFNEYSEEHAGTSNFKVTTPDVESLRSTLGSRFGYIYSDRSFKFETRLNAAWQREYLNKSQSIDYEPIAFNQPLTTLIVPNSGRDILLLGLDIKTTLKKKYSLEVSYDFQLNESFLDHNFYLGFSLAL